MKKLTGMKSNFSSLENKKMKDLKSIQGGLAAGTTKVITSNVPSGPDCTESDHYNDNGGYIGRLEVCGPY